LKNDPYFAGARNNSGRGKKTVFNVEQEREAVCQQPTHQSLGIDEGHEEKSECIVE
jgi:hypothetical protein